jgi:flagellar biosynthesis/type III secretory pathway protein FliH
MTQEKLIKMLKEISKYAESNPIAFEVDAKAILDKTYENGFEDGYNEGQEDAKGGE